MNRPKIKDYNYFGLTKYLPKDYKGEDFEYRRYCDDLEKYCDELEHKAEIDRLTIDCLVDSNEKYKKIIEMYEKELKKDEQRSLVSDDERMD